MVKLFKLNFEKTVILVLVMILLISSTSIYTQFFDLIFKEKTINTVQTGSVKDMSFPIILLKADQLYKEERYKEAQTEYLTLTNMPTLSSQQKAVAYFKLGLCNYKLKLYDLAFDSFIKSTNFNTGDEVAYNNAAVSAYLMKDMQAAELYQKKAISMRPVTEFYYNLGRIYESQRLYGDAAKYYIAAINGEDSITREDRIDPVQLKNKVIKLLPEKLERDELSKDFFMALKLRDSRETFIINDSYMDVREDFNLKLVNDVSGSRLYCNYDREAMDPYHLIDSINWTVKSNNRTIFTGKRDDFSIKVQEQNDYEVSLNIKYNGNKVKDNSKVVKKWQILNNIAKNNTQHYKPTGELCNYYVYATYEQVFEKNFRLSSKGYTDRFNVVWGKDNVETTVMDQDFIDAGSALYIKNNSSSDAGIWADLSSLLDDKRLRGKTVSVKFYARKITENAKLDVKVRVKRDKIFNKGGEYNLDYRWQQFSIDVYIPEEASGMTFSANIKPNEEVKIDGFIISVIR